jgi:hypothetical protein
MRIFQPFRRFAAPVKLYRGLSCDTSRTAPRAALVVIAA